jgi:phosphoribosylformylglycinamidine synthase
VLGVVGLIDDVSRAVSPGFKQAGDVIVLLGENKEELGGSEYLKAIFDLEKGPPPRIDLKTEKKVHELCLEAISRGLIRSAHDVSEGGLGVALAECSFWSKAKTGSIVDLDDDIRPDALVFGESQSRIVVSVRRPALPVLLKLAQQKGVQAKAIGKTSGREMIIRHAGREIIHLPLESLFGAWKKSIPQAFSVP